jgi:hypothetical protein
LREEQKRLREQNRYWRDEARRARGEYFRGGRPPEAPPVPPPSAVPPPPPSFGPPPQRDQFADTEQWLEAKIQYENRKARYIADVEDARIRQQRSAEEKKDALRARIDEGGAKYPDFADIAYDESLPVSQYMADAMDAADNPADILYYLGKNRQVAAKIANMPSARAIKEIYAIEQQLKKNPLPVVTGAPPPINPVGSAHTVNKPLDKMNQREFEAEMERRTGYKF